MPSQPNQSEGDPASPATVLVVDDEPAIRSLLTRFLSKSGYTVLESADGRDALEQLRQRKVDLLISDIVMPERDGLEVLRSLRNDFAGLKVIVMSGAFDGRFLRTAEMLGAHATLQKPLRLDAVFETVRQVLGMD
ncbi:MAG: response regulator [Acidobacteria bacterium]|nr:response regulator [Acidobacteriota bacterium]MCI0621362.1 response regulator [Acidobacteriota bacterium]MCI0720091.1 response regulator [Acidobacteriota bacterium]